ncbi:MAG: metallophosphoesterase [Trueperaceae bacterium]|nr:metallophosphoesterase [Trueperaceae bacterium]
MPLSPIFPESRRIAIFSDIHGNRQALGAILKDMQARGIKDIACNGDLITSSAHSAEVVKKIRELGIPSTRGNHERYLFELSDPADEKWQLDNWAATRHEYKVLDTRDKSWLYDLPESLCLQEEKIPLFMTHGAPGDDRARLTSQTSEQSWQSIFASFPQNTTLIGSHLHRFWRYEGMHGQFVRTPSAGLPLDGDTSAAYCVLERQTNGWTVELCRVAYDLDKELADFKKSDFYQEGGVFTHLLWLELKTARWWVMPFFAHLATVFADSQEGRKGYSHEEMRFAWQSFDRNLYPDYDPDKSDVLV